MKLKRIQWLILPALLLGVATVNAAKHEYKWVEDKQVSSQDILISSLSTRIVQMSKVQALKTVRSIMSRELHMKLSKYDEKNSQQAAQTTPKTVLPKEIAGLDSKELAGEDYVFLLEVELKKIGNHTRITAKAQPIYRVRKKEGEEEKDTITVKVKAEPGQAVALGPMFVMPIAGRPADYHAQMLPDAAQRCANLVRYFMLKLDQRIGAENLKTISNHTKILNI